MPILQHRWPEFIIFLLSLVAVTVLDRRDPLLHTQGYYRLNDWILRTTFQPRRAYGYLAGYTLALLLLLSFMAWPYPIAPEEFSLRLAADTFAHGRLTNPTHPLWTFFETMQVISKPFYASKYPPAPGMIMAFGQFFLGTPVAGIWLAYVGAVLAVYWVLTLCLPPVPALVGGALVATHATFVLNWGLAFWGGGVLMAGGALVLGATLSLLRQPRGRHVSLMALGLLLLWTDRTYEGLVFSLIPVGVLLYMLQQVQYWHGTRPLLRWIPGLLLIGVSLLAQPAYNEEVTGEPFRAPHSLYYTQYEQARLLVFQSAKREPFYNRPEMKKMHKREAANFFYRETVEGFLGGILTKVIVFENFYLSLLFLVPFVLFLISPKAASDRVVLWMILVLFGANLICVQEMPQCMAPATAALAVAVGQGMLFMWQANMRWREWGQRCVLAVLLSALPLLLWESIQQARSSGRQLVRQRQADEDYLDEKGGQHVVLVKYGPQHPVRNEWVYNLADIGQQSVIWAVDKGAIQNQALFRYYPTRTFWQVRPDENGSRLYRLKVH